MQISTVLEIAPSTMCKQAFVSTQRIFPSLFNLVLILCFGYKSYTRSNAQNASILVSIIKARVIRGVILQNMHAYYVKLQDRVLIFIYYTD